MTLEEVILSILESRTGKANRISRANLRQFVSYRMFENISDREVRKTIEELRRSNGRGALICSSSGSAGYWFAESYAELLENYREERRRALSLMYTMRQRLRAGRHHFTGQMRLI